MILGDFFQPKWFHDSKMLPQKHITTMIMKIGMSFPISVRNSKYYYFLLKDHGSWVMIVKILLLCVLFPILSFAKSFSMSGSSSILSLESSVSLSHLFPNSVAAFQFVKIFFLSSCKEAHTLHSWHREKLRKLLPWHYFYTREIHAYIDFCGYNSRRWAFNSTYISIT